MRFLTLALGSVLLVCTVDISEAKNICYHAKTCIHNGVEKCGVDKNGHFRRFFDSCDMLEYNCLKNTDFEKSEADECQSLPPIEPESRADSP